MIQTDLKFFTNEPERDLYSRFAAILKSNGKQLRGFFAEKTNPLILIDFSGCKIFESATVDVNILSFTKSANAGKTRALTASDGCVDNMSVYVRQCKYRNEVKDTMQFGWVDFSKED